MYTRVFLEDGILTDYLLYKLIYMEDSFKSKYLKYKKKYLSLKKQIGGDVASRWRYGAQECPCQSYAGKGSSGDTCWINEKEKGECGPTTTKGTYLNSGYFYRDCNPLYDVHCPNPEISEEMKNERKQFEDGIEAEKQRKIEALAAARAAYANSPAKRKRDSEYKRIQDEYEQSIKKTYRGRVLLKKWFGGEDDYRGRKLSNNALLDSAELFSLGENRHRDPMRGRLPTKRLNQANNQEISEMSRAAIEILGSDANWRLMKKAKEIEFFYKKHFDRFNY